MRKKYQPARFKENGPSSERLVVWQGLCFAALVGMVWLNDAFHLTSVLVVTIEIVFIGVLAVLPVMYRRAQNRSSVLMCSYCRRVRVGPTLWEHLESFLARHTDSDLSHGVCPECRRRVMDAYQAARDEERRPAPEPAIEA